MSLEMVAQKTRATGINEIAETLNFVLYGAIKAILGDTLLDRARACESNGLELWRRLHVEWDGAAPLVISAKARVWQDPHRCSSVLQLWDTLGNWERLGAEIALVDMTSRMTSRLSPLRSLSPSIYSSSFRGKRSW